MAAIENGVRASGRSVSGWRSASQKMSSTATATSVKKIARQCATRRIPCPIDGPRMGTRNRTDDTNDITRAMRRPA